tara:strand:- start:167 stop:673 length:507 start_codon:yes stop_codon:yes gene_type:complete
MALKELIGEGINFLNISRSDSSLTDAERFQMNSIWESQEAEDIIKKTALEADGWSGEINEDTGIWKYTKTLTEKQKRDRDSAVLQEFSAPEEGGYDKALTTREPPRLARPSEPRQLGYRDTEVPNPVTTYMQPRFQNSAAYDQRAKEQIAGLLASPKISSVLGKLLLG